MPRLLAKACGQDARGKAMTPAPRCFFCLVKLEVGKLYVMGPEGKMAHHQCYLRTLQELEAEAKANTQKNKEAQK